MSQSFVYSVLAFTIVMLLFNVIKDLYIRYNNITISDKLLKKIDKRWLISYTIGVLILYLLYGGP